MSCRTSERAQKSKFQIIFGVLYLAHIAAHAECNTGCGKSSVVPMILMDSPMHGPRANIAVTQPRRLAAISISKRVASQLGEHVGGTVGH